METCKECAATFNHQWWCKTGFLERAARRMAEWEAAKGSEHGHTGRGGVSPGRGANQQNAAPGSMPIDSLVVLRETRWTSYIDIRDVSMVQVHESGTQVSLLFATGASSVEVSTTPDVAADLVKRWKLARFGAL